MLCNYFHKSISSSLNVFVRWESQHNTTQTINQIIRVTQTDLTQTMQSITYFGPRIINTVLVNIRRCGRFIPLNKGWKLMSWPIMEVICNITQYYHFFSIAFLLWLMSKGKFSTSYSKIDKIILNWNDVCFTNVSCSNPRKRNKLDTSF